MLRILNITAPDITNGNGIRITLWVAGCNHQCKGCHTPWTWNYNQGDIFKDNKEIVYNKLRDWLKRDYVEGLTLSGGDPMSQDSDGLKSILEIIKWVHEEFPSKNIWLYTGDLYENITDPLKLQILDNIDVLVDGPFILEKRDICHTPFRGSTNQRILYMKELRGKDKNIEN